GVASQRHRAAPARQLGHPVLGDGQVARPAQPSSAQRIATPHLSSPRKRGSRFDTSIGRPRALLTSYGWIPACAGMTVGASGRTIQRVTAIAISTVTAVDSANHSHAIASPVRAAAVAAPMIAVAAT